MKKQYRAYLKRRVNRRNIVGCYMLRPFGHPVACCSLLLGCCAKFETGQNCEATLGLVASVCYFVHCWASLRPFPRCFMSLFQVTIFSKGHFNICF